MKMHNPPHPGEVLRTLCIEPIGISVTDAAKGLGVSRKTLSAILNGRAGISPEMAIRLSKAFDTSAESWLNQQTQYDLWHSVARRRSCIAVRCDDLRYVGDEEVGEIDRRALYQGNLAAAVHALGVVRIPEVGQLRQQPVAELAVY